jgi:outer membrane protein assembly factor BamB
MATPIRDFAATGGENGNVLRRFALIGYCDQRAALTDGGLVFGAPGGFLFALDADAGREVRRH